MHSNILVWIFIRILVMGGLGLATPGIAQEAQLGNEAVTNQFDIVSHLRKEYPHYSFILRAKGACSSNDPNSIRLPKITWLARGSNSSHILDLSKALGGNAYLSFESLSPDIYAIKWSGVSDDILQTTIPILRLSDRQRFLPEEIISSALLSKPVRLRMIKNNKKYLIKLAGLTSNPLPTSPHIERVLRNITIEDVLLIVLKKFGGIVSYSECTFPDGSGRINVDYYRSIYYPVKGGAN